MQFTEENRPRCIKCEEPAISYLNGIWVCGKCLSDYIQRLEKQQQKLFLEG